MFDLELAIRALAAASFVLFFTPAVRSFGLSQRAARRFQLAAFVLFGVAVILAIGATVQWFAGQR